MHREDSLVAARGYIAMFGGRPTTAALVAAEQFHRAIVYLTVYYEAMARAGGKR